MRASKEKYLHIISKKFQETYAQVGITVKSKSSDSSLAHLKSQLEQLEQLDILYKRTDAFPVWPLDLGSILRFSRAIALSLAPTVISIAIKISGITIG